MATEILCSQDLSNLKSWRSQADPFQIMYTNKAQRKNSRGRSRSTSSKEDKNRRNPSKHHKPRKPNGPFTYSPFAILMGTDKKS